MIARVIDAERLVVVVGGIVVCDGSKLGLRCGRSEKFRTQFRTTCRELMCESLGEGTDVEFCRAVGDGSRNDDVAANGGNVDQLCIFYLSEVSYEECGKDGQCLDV